jgi:hypothetical protein
MQRSPPPPSRRRTTSSCARRPAMFDDLQPAAIVAFHERPLPSQSGRSRRRRGIGRAPGAGSRRTIAAIACCGTKRIWPAGATCPTPRSPRTSARSTATTNPERCDRAHRRGSSPGWPRSGWSMAPGTTPKPRGR